VEHQTIDHRLIFRLAYRALDQALAAGHSAVFDASNLTIARRRKAIVIGQRYDAEVIAHYFDVTPRTAIGRNAGRARRVPPGAIVHMAKLLQPPSLAEGFIRIVIHH
jgi:predicted kinase